MQWSFVNLDREGAAKSARQQSHAETAWEKTLPVKALCFVGCWPLENIPQFPIAGKVKILPKSTKELMECITTSNLWGSQGPSRCLFFDAMRHVAFCPAQPHPRILQMEFQSMPCHMTDIRSKHTRCCTLVKTCDESLKGHWFKPSLRRHDYNIYEYMT